MINNPFKSSKDGLEKLFDFLTKCSGVENVRYIKVDDYGFSRNISFDVFNKEYLIIWFRNTMTLIAPDGLNIMFDYLHNQNTWPVRAKESLTFLVDPSKVVAFLKTEDYDVDKGRRSSE